MVKWHDQYRTGISHIDAQHKLLFEFFNDMEIVFKEGRGESYMQKCFPILENYVMTHFGYESECMHKGYCPAAKLNDDAHTVFMKSVQIFKGKFLLLGYTNALMEEMHKFLESWLKNHILRIDIQLLDPAFLPPE